MTIHNIGHGEQQLAEALTRLQDLERSVASLSRRVAALENPATERTEAQGTASPDAPPAEPSLWSWLGESRVLPRVAMVCFVLVIALILRTLTNDHVVDSRVGIWLGLGYSGLLIALGWRRLARRRAGQRVLPACGIMLCCAVLLEARGMSTAMLSAPLTASVLGAALVVVSGLGFRYRAPSLPAFAVLSTSITAIAAGFPHPHFAPAASVVLLANLVAFAAHDRGLCRWLPWGAFGVTLFLWLVWGFQASAFHRGAGEPAAGLDAGRYLPFLVTYVLLYAVASLRRALDATRSAGSVALLLPPLNVLWGYGAAFAVLAPQERALVPLASIGLGAALLHFAAALLVARRPTLGTGPTTSLTIAGTFLFVLATPSLLDRLALVLPLWSALAVGLMALAVRHRSLGLRGTSYALQLATCALAISTGLFAVPPNALSTQIAAAATIAVLAGLHFRLARRHPHVVESWFTRLDPADRTALTLFWVAAAATFGALRLLAFDAIRTPAGADHNTFACVQSVIVNCASIALMLWATRVRSRDLLITAVLVAVFGALRLVTVDLPNGQGLPVVLAVGSFGAAAAVGSIVLGKWQRLGATPPAA